MKHEALLVEMTYVEDEYGVILYNLTAAELKYIAQVCFTLADLPEDERDKLYSQLNPDRMEDETLYDDDEDSELN